MYSFEGRVRYSECDETGRLSLEAIVNYLQDSSTFQSEDLGQGFATLGPRGIAWVLGAWRIEIAEAPRLGEHIRILTWCYEMTRAHALRCFAIEDASGRRLVTADSQWFVLDRSCDRIVRVPQDQYVYLSDEPRADMAPLERRMRAQGPVERAETQTVRRHQLDTNHHMNNAQYVLMAADALDELGYKAPIASVSVSYRKMALLGERVTPLVSLCPGGHDVSLTNEDGEEYALVRVASN